MWQQTGTPLTLFYAYAQEDEPLREQLEKHLRLLSRQGLISEWHHRKITPGAEWAQKIDTHLETASIILLLISPDFLVSDYCSEIEMQRALERHKRGETRVIPIMLRPCEWQKAPFAHLHVLPRDGKPVTEWRNLDAAFHTIAQGIRRAIEQRTPSVRPVPRLSPIDRQNRARLLKRVRTIWIEGILEHSFHHSALIALDLRELLDALANPWHLEVQETKRPPHPLPAGTSIVQVYDEAESDLLILGEPGAGKTTLLLELARTLLERAENDEQRPIPVVFNLSSWMQRSIYSLPAWLVNELESKYQVPRAVGEVWVEAGRILPLLDELDAGGSPEWADEFDSFDLDEMDADDYDDYPEGADEINSSHEQSLGNPFVVCCRITEYDTLSTWVQGGRAVLVLPLTAQQIEHYLSSAQGNLEGVRGVRQLLEQNAAVRELATTPLMLSILTSAYHDTSPDSLDLEAAPESLRHTIFTAYVNRMLKGRGKLRTGTDEQIRCWLRFLAVQMQQHHQTEFYLEQLRQDWLPGNLAQSKLVFRWGIGLSFGLGAGLICGLIYGLFFIFTRQADGALASLFMTLIFSLFFMMVGVLISSARYDYMPPAEVFTRSRRQFIRHLRLSPNEGTWRSARKGLIYGLSAALFFWLFAALLYGLGYGLLYGLGLGLWAGLMIGPLFGLIYGREAFKHFVLRFWLWRAGSLPWNLAAFLDEAAERLLLHKVGGGYIFIHGLLLDYFANLEKKGS